MVVGVIREDCFADTLENIHCISESNKKLKKGEIILIGGVGECTNQITSYRIPYYEILFNNKIWYLDTAKVITDNSYFDKLEDMTSESAERFKNKALYYSKAIQANEIRKATIFFEACKKQGLMISDWSFYDESEYSEGTSVKISIANPTNKVIKYVWFTLVGYNAVKDAIVDTRRHTSNIVMKAIGPIEPDKAGEYTFEYVWFTDLVQSMKISQVKVQYMDGTFKSILNPKSIMLSDANRKLLEDE
jgi:hypothetical protein